MWLSLDMFVGRQIGAALRQQPSRGTLRGSAAFLWASSTFCSQLWT